MPHPQNLDQTPLGNYPSPGWGIIQVQGGVWGAVGKFIFAYSYTLLLFFETVSVYYLGHFQALSLPDPTRQPPPRQHFHFR
jgi:hypothetical protein